MGKLYPNKNGPPTDTCRAIDELRLPWPYTRSIWRKNPVFRREPTPAQAARGECGTVNHCAIDVLEDVIGWYRIKRVQDEATGQIVSEERLFDGESLQKDYAKWGEDLGYTKRQVQDGVAHLHDAGLIHRWCETRLTDYGVKIGNAVFVEPNPNAIRALSRPVAPQGGDTPPLPYKRERGHIQRGEGSRQNGRSISRRRETLKSLESASKPQANPQQQQEAPASPEPTLESESPVVAGDDHERREADVIFEGDDLVLAPVASPPTLNLDDGPDPTPNPAPQELLLAELVFEGLGESQARKAVAESYEAAVMQLDNLRHALPGEKILPSRGGWLHLAITRGYGHTKGYAQHLAERKASEERRAAQEQREKVRLARMEAERVPFDAIMNDLTPEEDAAIRQKARNCVDPEMRALGERKCARLVKANYEGLLRGEEKSEYSFWAVPEAAADSQGPVAD